MIGKIISKTIKTVTLPLDAINSLSDIACGGSGDKEERNSYDSPTSMMEKIRDKIADAAEDIDK